MKKIGVIGLPGSWSSEELADVVQKKTGFRLLMDMEKIFLDLDKGTLLYNDFPVENLDAIIIKKISMTYSPHSLERLEMLRYLEDNFPGRIFSKPSKILNLINRLSCTITLRKNQIPIPQTTITENIQKAKEVVQYYKKCVFKPMYTSKARGMEVICNDENLETNICEFHNKNPIMYIQKMIEPLTQDLGVMFLGGQYIGTYARVKNANTWNTTTHSGGKYQTYTPSNEVIDLAKRAQSLFHLDFTCVDVVETDDGPKVFEVSAFGGFKGILEANNISAAELYVDYVLDSTK